MVGVVVGLSTQSILSFPGVRNYNCSMLLFVQIVVFMLSGIFGV